MGTVPLCVRSVLITRAATVSVPRHASEGHRSVVRVGAPTGRHLQPRFFSTSRLLNLPEQETRMDGTDSSAHKKGVNHPVCRVTCDSFRDCKPTSALSTADGLCSVAIIHVNL
jgi:hypothetical protein